MKILKNFKTLNNGGVDEYPAIEIRTSDTVVFAELPLCLIKFNQEFSEPILLGYNQAGIGLVIEKKELEQKLTLTKKIYFIIDENNIPQISKEPTNIFTRLPKEDDETKYEYDYKNSQIFVIEKEVI